MRGTGSFWYLSDHRHIPIAWKDELKKKKKLLMLGIQINASYQKMMKINQIYDILRYARQNI